MFNAKFLSTFLFVFTLLFAGNSYSMVRVGTATQDNGVSPQHIKEFVNDCLDMKKFRDYYSRMLILHGPTGNGKSETIRMIAKRTNRKLVFVNAALLGNSYRDSEIINVKETVQGLAKEGEPCIFAVENAELLKGGAVSALLRWFEKSKNIVFIFETCHLGRIDRRLRNKETRERKKIEALEKFFNDSDMSSVFGVSSVVKEKTGNSIFAKKSLLKKAIDFTKSGWKKTKEFLNTHKIWSGIAAVAGVVALGKVGHTVLKKRLKLKRRRSRFKCNIFRRKDVSIRLAKIKSFIARMYVAAKSKLAGVRKRVVGA